MELTRSSDEKDYRYTREQILLLRADHSHSRATLPEHLFCPEYLTSHGKFSPDKYVECLWKNERTQKSTVSRLIRSDIPEILQNGSTLSPQRRNFQGGCKESLNSVFSQPSARNLKNDKRGTTSSTWSGFNKGYTNGYRSANSTHDSKNGRRDSEQRVEPLPEWMDDGPVNNEEIMQLGGFEDQNKRLEESFQKLGLPDAISRQKNAEKEKVVLPESDAEFAAQFGILDFGKIESKTLNDQIEEPKASRLSRFFGGTEKQQPQQESSRQTPTSTTQNETVLPAVARLLSFGSKSMGPPINNESTLNSPLMDLLKQAQTNQPNVHTSSSPLDQITSSSVVQHHSPIQHQQPPPPQYHPAMNRFADQSPIDSSMTQKQKKNIDLVPTAVMLQRSTVKDEVDVRAPKFSNPNSPSPVTFPEHEMSGSQHSAHGNAHWQNDGQSSNDSNVNIPSFNYMPAFCRLGLHIFPLPNPIALAADQKHMQQTYLNGDYKALQFIQTRYNVQMQVFAAVQHFRADASFLVVTADDPQFDHLLKSFIEQQRQIDSSLTEKSDDELVECSNPNEVPQNDQKRFSPAGPTALERLMSNPGSVSLDPDPNSFANLNILNKLPTNAAPMTVEELEAQIMGNC